MSQVKWLYARMIRKYPIVKITGLGIIVCMLPILLKTLPDVSLKNLSGLGKMDTDFNSELRNIERSAWKANLSKMFTRKRLPVDCALLIQDDPYEHFKASNFHIANPKIPIPESEYIAKTQDCQKFIAENDYYKSSPLPGEEDFPLAFSILVYKDIEQFERLLRAIYRPQNVYCVHVDSKSSLNIHLAIRSISRCFDNVFVLENHVEVTWGTYAVLEPEIRCMEALLKYRKWKYFINLTGQEFPLKTNWELVQILKAIKGANLVSATRTKLHQENYQGRPPPPIPVTVYKGSAHVLLRREFVKYVINDEDLRKFRNWVKLIDFPDEYFYSTLNHNPQLKIPGSYLGIPESYIGSYGYPFINRYKMWKKSNRMVCSGKFVRSVCILGVGDLPRLANSRFLFANKFHLDYQPLALDCLEELIYNRTLAELSGLRIMDLSFYRDLQVAKNHI